jgi:hypothetical protein
MWTPLDIPDSPKQPFTDYSRWRLRDTYDGRHVWDFLKSDKELEAHPLSDADKYWLGLPLVSFHFPLVFLGAPFPEQLKQLLSRISHHSPLQSLHWTQPGTDTHTTDDSKEMMAIGLPSLVVLCFSYLA